LVHYILSLTFFLNYNARRIVLLNIILDPENFTRLLFYSELRTLLIGMCHYVIVYINVFVYMDFLLLHWNDNLCKH